MKTPLSSINALRICLGGVFCFMVAALAITARHEKSFVNPASLTFSPDGGHLLEVTSVAQLWDLSQERPRPIQLPLVHDETHWTSPYGVEFVAHGVLAAYRRSVSRDTSDELVLFDVASERQPRVIPLPYRAEAIRIAANSPIAVAASAIRLGATLDLFDLETGTFLGPLPQSESVQGKLRNQFAVSADGRRVIASHLGFGAPPVLKVWDTRSRSLIQSFQIESGYGLVVSPDGKLMVDDGRAIWELETGQRLTAIDWSEFAHRSAAFSPDGKMLALGCYIGTVKVWDTATGDPLAVLSCGSTQRAQVAFSPDGSVLAVAAGRALRLWDATSLCEIATLRRDGRAVAVVAYAGLFLGLSVVWGLVSRRAVHSRRQQGRNASKDLPRSPWFLRLAWLLLGISGVATVALSLGDIFTIIHCSLCTPVWFVYLGYYGVVVGTFALAQAVGRSRTRLREAALLQLPCILNGHFFSVVIAAVVWLQSLWMGQSEPPGTCE